MKTRRNFDTSPNEPLGRHVQVLSFKEERAADAAIIGGWTSAPHYHDPFSRYSPTGKNPAARPLFDELNVSVNSDASGHRVAQSEFASAHELLEIGKRFDVEYYAGEYPDIVIDRSQLLTHFCAFGWREGRNPNAFFDTVSYLLLNTDVAISKINPYYHYLKHGMFEGRIVSSSISPSIRSRLLFGAPIRDWVERLRPHIDHEFYRRQLDETDTSGIDLAAHFAYRGWREGKSPNSTFDVLAWLEAHPAARTFAVNPLLIQLEADNGDSDLHRIMQSTTSNSPPGATEPPQLIKSAEISDFVSADAAASGSCDDDQLNLLRSEFDSSFYLACYPDVAQAGVNPLLHFFHTGWREGRNPSLRFDTRYYLEVNEDVRDAELNPFLHYLSSGRGEGRLPRRPGGYRRQIIDAAVEPAKRAAVGIIEGEKTLSAAALLRKLTAITKRKRGLIVSLSHDCYIRVIGGTQIFIADEQSRFNQLGYAYVHISPQLARLMLAEQNPQFLARIVVDGAFLGLAPIAAVIRAFETIRSRDEFQSHLVVHSMMGFQAADVISLCRALQPRRRIYWLHDYSSVCEGFNLLRNDAQFCGAPSARSLACRVCVYGKTRHNHHERMRSLFETCNFDVVSPSPAALNLWLKSTDLPRNSVTVHPHWQLVTNKRRRKRSLSKVSDKRISVAFVGFTSASKGWPLFSELVQRLSDDSRYKLFHFAAKGTSSLPHVEFVRTEVTGADRYATRRLLAARRIDLVMLLSPWPETFSFVAHEAVAAGAQIICLSDSGNVADLVRKLNCGQIFQDGATLIEFFASGAAASLMRANKGRGISYEIDQIGTTATIEGIIGTAEGQVP